MILLFLRILHTILHYQHSEVALGIIRRGRQLLEVIKEINQLAVIFASKALSDEEFLKSLVEFNIGVKCKGKVIHLRK